MKTACPGEWEADPSGMGRYRCRRCGSPGYRRGVFGRATQGAPGDIVHGGTLPGIQPYPQADVPPEPDRRSSLEGYAKGYVARVLKG